MTQTAATNSVAVIPVAPVKKEILVKAPQKIAFQVFTENMTTWWDVDEHHIGQAKVEKIVLERHVGGRWFELGIDGSECDWGRVLAWDPHSSVTLSWQISTSWQFDPELLTEVDIQFHVVDATTTRVTLEHRLDGYGPAAETMQQVFDSPTGWLRVLERFATESARASG